MEAVIITVVNWICKVCNELNPSDVQVCPHCNGVPKTETPKVEETLKEVVKEIPKVKKLSKKSIEQVLGLDETQKTMAQLEKEEKELLTQINDLKTTMDEINGKYDIIQKAKDKIIQQRQEELRLQEEARLQEVMRLQQMEDDKKAYEQFLLEKNKPMSPDIKVVEPKIMEKDFKPILPPQTIAKGFNFKQALVTGIISGLTTSIILGIILLLITIPKIGVLT